MHTFTFDTRVRRVQVGLHVRRTSVREPVEWRHGQGAVLSAGAARVEIFEHVDRTAMLHQGHTLADLHATVLGGRDQNHTAGTAGRCEVLQVTVFLGGCNMSLSSVASRRGSISIIIYNCDFLFVCLFVWCSLQPRPHDLAPQYYIAV